MKMPSFACIELFCTTRKHNLTLSLLLLEFHGNNGDSTAKGETSEDSQAEFESPIGHALEIVHMLRVFVRRVSSMCL